MAGSSKDESLFKVLYSNINFDSVNIKDFSILIYS